MGKRLSREQQRAVAMVLLREGSLSVARIARELHLERQTVQYWAKHADFDWRAVRRQFIEACVARARRETGG